MLTFKRLGKLMKGCWLFYAISILGTLINAFGQTVGPMITRTTLDNVLGDVPIDAPNVPRLVVTVVGWFGGTANIAAHLWLCTVAMLSVTLINAMFGYLRGAFAWRAGERMAEGLKNRLFDHLQRLPYDYHIKAQTGDLIQRCTSDVDTVRRFVQGTITEIIRPFLWASLFIAVMGSLSLKLTLVAVAALPILVVAAYIFFTKVRAAFLKSDEKEGELSACLQESMSGVRVVRAFGRQKYELDKFEGKNAQFRDLNYRNLKYLAAYWGASDLVCMTQISAVVVVGAYMAYTGEITVGTAVLFVSYIQNLVWPIRQMGRFLSDAGKMQVSIGRVFEILDSRAEEDTPGSSEHDLNGDIVFDRVSFEYETGKPILRDMSFTVKQGETIAILGATGSGKTTLMHLLLRLYDYGDGNVTINGRELRLITKNHLRSRIGMVLQEPFLFSRTIKENIQMARSDAQEADIVEVAKVAAVHDDIMGFEKKYDTIVGEKGVTLSGGQKQRVAIARTLIKNSDILIFDDSLSAVDTETDSKIRAALRSREHKATTFIISQRITTLMQADRIFVVENGTLTAVGTHKELIERDGLYSRIWNIQSMLSDDFESESEVI